MADKHNIHKGKMHSNCRLLSNHIVCNITQRNSIRRANTCDPALKLLNEEITSDIQKKKKKTMEGILRCTLGSQTQHTPSLEDHTRSIQQSTTTHTKHITFSNKIATFHQTIHNAVKLATYKTNR